MTMAMTFAIVLFSLAMPAALLLALMVNHHDARRADEGIEAELVAE